MVNGMGANAAVIMMMMGGIVNGDKKSRGILSSQIKPTISVQETKVSTQSLMIKEYPPMNEFFLMFLFMAFMFGMFIGIALSKNTPDYIGA